MRRILLMNLPSTIAVYRKSALKGVIGALPPLTLAHLASAGLAVGAECRILDLQASAAPLDDLTARLADFRPDLVGITCTSLLHHEAEEIARFIKARDARILVVVGGPHASLFHRELIEKGPFDIAVRGEGELTLEEILRERPLAEVAGITYRAEDGRVIENAPRPLLKNLDELPLPAWHLVDVAAYALPRPFASRSPVGPMMSSRGCPYGCTYCCHATFGRTYRAKSVERVVEEFQDLVARGFRELMIWDDMFALDLERAKRICDELVRREVRVPWQIETGLRVDHVDRELFLKLKQAGCYKTAFGFESGSDAILRSLNKGTTTEQARTAVRWAKAAGLETVGFFMLGLPDETPETLDATLRFSRSLDLDYAKATIFVPFPATRDFLDLDARGLIETKDWRQYNFHTASRVFRHPRLSWSTLASYYRRFHKEFYFRPGYIVKRAVRSARKGMLLDDFKVAVATFGK